MTLANPAAKQTNRATTTGAQEKVRGEELSLASERRCANVNVRDGEFFTRHDVAATVHFLGPSVVQHHAVRITAVVENCTEWEHACIAQWQRNITRQTDQQAIAATMSCQAVTRNSRTDASCAEFLVTQGERVAKQAAQHLNRRPTCRQHGFRVSMGI